MKQMPRGPFDKTCAWCGNPFTTMHASYKCCGPDCRDKQATRRRRNWWRKFYRANRPRLLAYYRSYHAANKEARNAKSREWHRKHGGELTEAQIARRRASQRIATKKYKLVNKVIKHWRVTAAEAREMIRTGSFPP